MQKDLLESEEAGETLDDSKGEDAEESKLSNEAPHESVDLDQVEDELKSMGYLKRKKAD